MRPRALLASLLLGALLTGCGGDGDSGGDRIQDVTLSPKTARLTPAGIQSFTAVLNGGTQPVTWSVEGTNSGTIDSSGRYTAPLRSGSYTVRATLKSDSSKSGTATVIVDSGFNVTISGAATIGQGATSTYTAAVTGTSNSAVTWSATAGTITPAGVFTAPNAEGEVTITATSVADPGESDTFKVTIAPAVGVVAPAAGSVAVPGSRLTFTATVDGVASTDVNWTASAGTIDANGKWIAPTAPGTATITASKKGDATKFATVQAQTVADVDAVMVVEGRGTIVFDLQTSVSPNTVANYVSLINESFYDGIIVHRYDTSNQVVQWGDPQTKTLSLDDPRIGQGGPGYTIPYENNPLKNVKYSLGMARSSSRDSGGSQVYVNLANNTGFDGNYVVFGGVRDGVTVLDALRRGDKITSIRVVAR